MKRIKNDGEISDAKNFINVRRFLIYSLFAGILFCSACNSRSFENTNASAPSATENKQVGFESDLQTMKTANLQYIFVLRRKNGGAFDAEDKKYLRANLPTTNRVILADEDKAVIVGSNYKFPPENLDALQMRFNIEDYSTAEQVK